jgi:hypothetical protein
VTQHVSTRALRSNNVNLQPTYYPNFIYLGTQNTGENGAQGIKVGPYPNSYVITGTYGNISSSGQGAIYAGAINGSSTSEGSGSGSWVIMNTPSSWTGGQNYSTSIYGPGAIVAGNGTAGISSIELAGTYTTPVTINNQSTYRTLGFTYKGPLTSTTSSSDFVQFEAKTNSGGTTFDTFLHSWSGNLIAGNYTMQNRLLAITLNTGLDSSAFVYDPITKTQHNLVFNDGSASHTAFGIWYNGKSSWNSNNDSYTIAGGRSIAHPAIRKLGSLGEALGAATIADYDPITGAITNLRDYQYQNNQNAYITHFEGIYYMGNNIYQMPFSASSSQGSAIGTAYAKRLSDGSFSRNAYWHTMSYSSGTLLTNDSCAGLASVGQLDMNNTINPWASMLSDKALTWIMNKADQLT